MSADSYDVRNITDKAAEVAIYDAIGFPGITAKEFSNSIKSLGNRRLTVRIHSPGGEIFDGEAIYNSLKRHKGGVDVAIDGIAASMATVIAMAGEKRSMAENAWFMIHNPFAGTVGGAEELRKEAGVLDRLKDSIITRYAGRTGLSREILSDMMDDETWLSAKEAKEMGFITDITEAMEMKNSIRCFDISKFCNTPKSLMESTPEGKEVIESELDVNETEEIISALEGSLDEFEGRLAGIETSYQAALTAKDAVILAKDQEIVALNDLLAKYNEKLGRLEKLAGVAPAEVVIPAAKQPESKSIIDQYNALEGEAQTAFYKQHRAEILPLIKA